MNKINSPELDKKRRLVTLELLVKGTANEQYKLPLKSPICRVVKEK